MIPAEREARALALTKAVESSQPNAGTEHLVERANAFYDFLTGADE